MVRYGGTTTIRLPKDQIGFSPISPFLDGNSEIASVTHVFVPRPGSVPNFMPLACFVWAVEGGGQKGGVSFSKLGNPVYKCGSRIALLWAIFSNIDISTVFTSQKLLEFKFLIFFLQCTNRKYCLFIGCYAILNTLALA